MIESLSGIEELEVDGAEVKVDKVVRFKLHQLVAVDVGPPEVGGFTVTWRDENTISEGGKQESEGN